MEGGSPKTSVTIPRALLSANGVDASQAPAAARKAACSAGATGGGGGGSGGGAGERRLKRPFTMSGLGARTVVAGACSSALASIVVAIRGI